MSTKLNYVILKIKEVKRDWKNGRKVLVNEIYPTTEKPIENSIWKSTKQGDLTPALETGCGGVEVSTFNEKTVQERHKHLICTEIYTVLEGKMSIKIDDKSPVILDTSDEMIVLPDTIHEVVSDINTHCLVRVHSINCHGDNDKYIEIKGIWTRKSNIKK